MKVQKYLLIAAALVFIVNVSFAQSVQPDKVVDIKVITPHGLSSSGVVDAEIVLNVKKGWHINANKPLDKTLSPTVLSFKDVEGMQVLKVTYPEPSLKKLPFSDSRLALYEDEVIIKVQLKITKKQTGQVLKFDGDLKYQPCNNETCLFPVSKPFTINLGSKKAK